MGSREQASQLRALAAAHDELADLADVALTERDAYRAALESGDQDAIEQARAAHREASQALNDAREATASSGVMVADGTPGSATVRPDGVKAGG